MNLTHEEFIQLIPDYIDDLLHDDEIWALEAHLETCEICAREVASQQAIRQGLKKTSRTRLSDEARLRLYQAFNDERVRRGESLLQIPAELLARAKAKAAVTAQATQKVIQESKDAGQEIGSGSAHFAKSVSQSSKRFGKKVQRGARNSARNATHVAKEMGQTGKDVARIVTKESYDVVSQAAQSKRKAAVAPARIMGKGVKAGARMMTGGAKTAAKSVKGGAVMAKDGASVMATGMIESARVGKAFAESTDKVVQAGSKIKQSVKDAVKEVAEENEA